jgi:hypothetical protein
MASTGLKLRTPRLQLLEIHEQPWCPPEVREGATDCLNFVAIVGRQYWHIVPKLRQALRRSQARRVVDLCSGSGGPWLHLHRQLARPSDPPLEVVLTDRYPSGAAVQMNTHPSRVHIRYLVTPVDATRLPADLDGFRTLFTAFHHFAPAKARSILQDAVDRRQGIAVFEQTQRSLLGCVTMLALPWIALLAAPFMRPFRLSRLFWTYVLPAIPLILCLDGIVSCLRTYSPDEMRQMIESLHGPRYIWEVGRAPSPLSPLGITYAIGCPAGETGTDAPRVDFTK